jgi:hypothetical protein
LDVDRLTQLQNEGLDDRLKQGAAYLGRLWRAGTRCRDSWVGQCPCGDQANPFCRAKERWISLLLERHSGSWPYGLTGREPFSMVEAMTVSMFEASGLTAIVELPGATKPIRVGPKASAWQTVSDLGRTTPGEDRKEALEAVEKIQKVFLPTS